MSEEATWLLSLMNEGVLQLDTAGHAAEPERGSQ